MGYSQNKVTWIGNDEYEKGKGISDILHMGKDQLCMLSCTPIQSLK